MFDDEPSQFHALITGIVIGAAMTLFWVGLYWVAH
jgi:multisubunit Na+/H+ antiporter MnhC subunit